MELPPDLICVRPTMTRRRMKVLSAQIVAGGQSKNSAEEMGSQGERLIRNARREQSSGSLSEGTRYPTLWNANPGLSDVRPCGSMRGKTVFISGSSRGIGKAIAVRLASDGANVVITGKTAEPHPTLPGTIFTTAEECEAAGGKALALVMDVRKEDSIHAAVAKTVERFGGIDACVSCASAIFPQPLGEMSSKRFDLMLEINTRGTLMVMKSCVPHLQRSAAAARNPQCLILSPPLDFSGSFPTGNTNYMVAKGGMTLAAMFAAQEFGREGIGFNTLWPTGLVTTSALNHMFQNDPGKLDEFMRMGRTPMCQANAAYALLAANPRSCTGNMTIDEDVLRRLDPEHDFAQYDYMTLGRTPEERLRGILQL